ncbi:MAG: helix-hairpin-helix domain-containing protein [Betaproteobacteria bacterium]
MDQTSTPWRALEDATDRPPAANQPASAQSGFPRSAVVAGGGAIVLALVAFLLALGIGSGGTVAVDVEGSPPVDAIQGGLGVAGTGSGADKGGASTPLIVEVVGAVPKPGIYRLPAGARIGDLVDAAGGYGPRVDTDRAGRELNLAAPLHDGDQIRVPSRDDPTTPSKPAGGGSGGGASGAAASAPLDLNQATAAELDGLPGIGPVTAAKILASRDEQPFASVDDLRARKLVGEKTFAGLKDLVTVR